MSAFHGSQKYMREARCKAAISAADPNTNDRTSRLRHNDERMQRESSLIAIIRAKLPDFAKACADDREHVLLHQDAFAADYQENEYTLLGMAIKYAGLRGTEVRVIGNNRSTLGVLNVAQPSPAPIDSTAAPACCRVERSSYRRFS